MRVIGLTSLAASRIIPCPQRRHQEVAARRVSDCLAPVIATRSTFHTSPRTCVVLKGGQVEPFDADIRSVRALPPTKARLTLTAVAFLYGTLNVCLRALYQDPKGGPVPSMLSFTRGILAALCFIPALAMSKSDAPPPPESAKASEGKGFAIAALELASWNFGAQGLINMGLLVSPAARASFLMQTSVVLTPVLSQLGGTPVAANVWVSCAIALAGLATLTGVVGGTAASGAVASGASFLGVGVGDALCLGGAACWSLYILRLGTLGDRFPEMKLQAAKTWMLAAMYAAWAAWAAAGLAWRTGGGGSIEAVVAGLWPGWASPSAWALLMFSAVGPGAVADVLQAVGQRGVGAAEASILLCAEPLFTAATAALVLGEVTTARDKMGGGLILLAALVASGAFSRGMVGGAGTWRVRRSRFAKSQL